MESPTGYPESPLDQDEIVYPCKGCGEILEEGKAFELAGNRWHIECFKCNTCGDPLDSDANLLLLGDGSLICNKCTYSCNACNQKIEDLAILTGDQAFCANCFRCRNCKRKIENLRYARTSQGIFCMSCHESLMARRRKKSRQKQQAAANGSGHYEKSLPALPPKNDPPETYDRSRDMSPNAQIPIDRNDRSPSNIYRDASPASHHDQRGNNLTLPASTYRRSAEVQSEEYADGPDEFFIPLAFDPNPAPGPSPHAQGRAYNEDTSAGATEPMHSRDYFNTVRPSQQTHRDHLREDRVPSSRSSSTERERQQKHSPHIAYQEKGRRPSDNLADTLRRKKDTNMSSAVPPNVAPERPRPQNTSSHSASPSSNRIELGPGEGFRLQEAPRKRSDSRTNSRNESWTNNQPAAGDAAAQRKSPPVELPTHFNTQELPTSYNKTREDMATDHQTERTERPKRDEASNKNISARVSIDGKSSPSTPTLRTHERKTSTSSGMNNRDPSSGVQTNGGLSISSPMESPVSKSIHDMSIPPRAPSRPAHSSAGPSKDSYTAPRAPPAPPGAPSSSHNTNESVSSAQSDATQGQQGSPPTILRYSGGPEFSLEADVARIMGDAESNEKESSVLRRVSNAVSKHGRSFSDRGSRASTGNKYRHGANGSVDIGSPTSASPDSKDELVELRNNLRRAHQKIAELEADKMTWQEKINSHADIKQANTELKEKRSTMAVLNTQREMIIRELEIITDRLSKAKDTHRPIDTSALRSDIYEEFSLSLEKLKDHLGTQIENLMQQRQELTTEISNLIQMKDKGFQEYESLSSKNQQLIEMNNQLVQNIQGMYKANKVAQPKQSFEGARPGHGADALGIYRMPAEEKSKQSMENRTISTENSGQNLLNDIDPDQTVISKPQIVDVKKAKANKFGNWKKGGGAAAKALGKNIKGAFASTNQQPMIRGDEPYQLISSPYNAAAPTDPFNNSAASSPSTVRPGEPQKGGSGFGFFGGPQKGAAPGKPSQLKNATNNDSNSTLQIESPSTLFGSDLTQRCHYEKRIIPNIVIRCIQEVQLRGMDLEGIYRKSGSQSQINTIRDGFNANDDYDISDPDMDITAVTSVLKAYFRKLPNPLITFEIYERFLAAGIIQDREKRVVELRNALNDLPKAHLECLQFLIFHLAQVTTKPETKMSALNLAVVFAPTIMRPESIEREMSDMQNQKHSVIALIEDVKEIFGTEAS